MALVQRPLNAMLGALVLMTLSASATHATTRCVIADPTDTPLNVRTIPNGKIITTLANGYIVSVIDTALDRDRKPWAYVTDYETDKPIGWVYRKFIVCGETSSSSRSESGQCTVSDPTGTPLNVRTTPKGKVFATLPNGMRVSIIDSSQDPKGKLWVYVSNPQAGEPIGWVYRNFLNCEREG